MATETRTLKEAGKAGEAPAPPKLSRIKTALKSAARIFASALLVSGLMLAPMKARVEEAAPQKAGIGVKLGAGYNHLEEEPRAIAIVNLKIPIVLGASLSGSTGVSSSTDGTAKWEEANLSLAVPICGPLFMDLYGYNSRHFGVPKIAAGGDIGVAIPRGAIIASYTRLFDFDADLVGLMVKADLIPKLLVVRTSGSWKVNTESGSIGAGVALTAGGLVPEIGVHYFIIFTKDQALFMDTVATLGWSF